MASSSNLLCIFAVWCVVSVGSDGADSVLMQNPKIVEHSRYQVSGHLTLNLPLAFDAALFPTVLHESLEF